MRSSAPEAYASARWSRRWVIVATSLAVRRRAARRAASTSRAAAHLDDVALAGVGDLPAHAHGQLGGGQHVGAGSLAPLDQPGVHEGLHGLADGVPPHAQQLDQRGLRGDAAADRPVAGGDACPELGHRRVDESGASRHAE
jgi:hypothetical protein